MRGICDGNAASLLHFTPAGVSTCQALKWVHTRGQRSREGWGTCQTRGESATAGAASASATPALGPHGSDLTLPPDASLLDNSSATVILGKHQGIVTQGPGSDAVRHLE